MLGDTLPNEMEHFKKCKSRYDRWASRKLECRRNPKVISMNLVWMSEEVSEILALMNSIPSHFMLSDLFQLGKKVKDHFYVFRGAAFYWGAHYFNYLRVIKPEGDAWIQVNDTLT